MAFRLRQKTNARSARRAKRPIVEPTEIPAIAPPLRCDFERWFPKVPLCNEVVAMGSGSGRTEDVGCGKSKEPFVGDRVELWSDVELAPVRVELSAVEFKTALEVATGVFTSITMVKTPPAVVV